MSHYTRITDYSETQNGLLKTRADLFNEAELLTERLAAIKNDVSALDRTLRTIGYEGELDMIMPRYQRAVRFDQGDLAKAVMFELRYANQPLKSREIAQNMLAAKGMDVRDKLTVDALTARVGKSLRRLRDKNVVVSSRGKSNITVWMIRPDRLKPPSASSL